MFKLSIASLTLSAAYGILALAISCTDHDVPVSNLPQSKCKNVDGSDRMYPCEFSIEKITFLGAGGAVVGTVTGSNQTLALPRSLAKTDNYTGNEEGKIGTATFGVRITLKRIASPSFPVNEGYLIGITHNTSGARILHTSIDGGTYGERDKMGPPVALNMAIDETMDVEYEMGFPYRLGMAGSEIVPNVQFPSTSFFIDNDVTTLKFPRTTSPYNSVGSVTEAFYERSVLTLKN
ncbi:hypothetical protein [Dyadobacter sp. CY347]|uniref:hypothetical protein n=1 Tax=Dyadobacter sp. CY347 TaxID=2909336 RepID=UPI001F1E1CC4|nr:hypothetical protein [Dyadobacter sp. CY347]MCF2488049.1 hypothetical protein [Dyadobacter sp. CY347]